MARFGGPFLWVKQMYEEEDFVPVDEYMREELGWSDVPQTEDNDWEQNFAPGTEIRYPKPVRFFCDGPYEKVGEGCYRRLPCPGSDDA